MQHLGGVEGLPPPIFAKNGPSESASEGLGKETFQAEFRGYQWLSPSSQV